MRTLTRTIPILLAAGCGTLAYYEPDSTPAGVDDTAAPDGTTPAGDDDDDDVSPAAEDCGNGVDDDGDGDADCDDPDCDSVCDADGDGVIAEARGGADCDDTNPNVRPGVADVCDGVDNDCSGTADDDHDGDGSGVCDDCDDGEPTVHPGATEICNDGIDNDCSGGDCSDFVEGFETGGLGARWSTGGSANWTVTGAAAHTGAWGAQSGPITHSQATALSITLSFPSGGSIEFWHSGDTESNYDFLRFFVDGVERDSWSGNWAWTRETYNASAGTHTFEWRYTKDGSVNTGLDAAVVDDIVAVGGQ